MNQTIEQIKEGIDRALNNKISARNSMGVSENYYNAYYMVGRFLEEKHPEIEDERTLNPLIELANYAGDCFY